MLINERDELLIQRCVDDELPAAETQALLTRLDELDRGWKVLACGLLEDRSLRKLLRTSAKTGSTEPASASSPVVLANTSGPVVPTARVSVGRARDVVRHWWSHPVTSLTLCAAIAFVGGMLIPDFRTEIPTVTSGNAVGAGNPGIPVGRSAASGPQSYQLQMPGSRPIEIPVYSELGQLIESDRRHPLLTPSADSRDSVRWIVIPAGENKSMLVPVSEDADLVIQ